MLRRVCASICCALAAAQVVCAQAAVEYGLKTGQSALAGSGGEQASIGACAVNSQFFSCASHNYPKTTWTVVVLAGLLILRWFAVRSGGRARY